MLQRFISWLEKPPRFDILDKWLKKDNINILDVGCGNHSPSKTKKYYPNCKYYGIDKAIYHNDENDFECMEAYYEFDIDNVTNLSVIVDDFFDCVILSHIIEHTQNGEEIIVKLLDKLKMGGLIYIETPSAHSVYLPSMKGTLNFYDDDTHVRIYTLKELKNLLIANGCDVIKSTIRMSLKRIVLLPIYFIGSLIRFKELRAIVFWDITGFVSHIIAVKK